MPHLRWFLRFHRRAASAAGPLLSLALLAGPASAHDTWFQPRPAASPPALWVGTGDRFPVLEYRVEFEHLARHGCAPHSELAAKGSSAGRPLVAVSGPAGRLSNALALRLPAAAGVAAAGASVEAHRVPHSCWASLVPFDIEIEPAKVELYLKEIAASEALRAAWAAEQAAGRPWRERYTKHLRIELGGQSPTLLGLALEAVALEPGVPRAGQAMRFRLLYAGQPLPDHPLELVSELSKIGLWRRTDGAGEVTLALPLAGRWLLRSTLLRAPAQAGARWESDFTTLAFDVEPAAPSAR
jgi:hypothetical protein